MEIVADKYYGSTHVLVAHYLMTPGKTAHEMQHEAVKKLVEILFPATRGEYNHYPWGAPYLPAYPDVTLTVSHTRGLVAVAADKVPIGVDIEQVSSRTVNVLPRVAHKSEISVLEMCDNKDAAYTMAWTGKEAVFKALPEGEVDFSQHIIINFPMPMWEADDKPTMLEYSAREYRSERQRCYEMISEPMTAENTGVVTHILTIARERQG